MPKKKKSRSVTWTDTDDGPPVTDAFFDRAEIRHGEKVIRPGHPPLERTQTKPAMASQSEGMAFLTLVSEKMKMQTAVADKKRLAEIRKQWSEFGEITDKDLLLRIGYSSPEFVSKLLSEHPAKKLFDSVENVERAYSILARSRSSFVDLAGKFHARVVHSLYEQADRKSDLIEATTVIHARNCIGFFLSR